MSEAMGEGLTPADSIAANQTAGAMLRAAREKSGLHIAALAVSMKVPVKKLEALESDRLDLLPDSVFVRALASSVCRTLKIDAAPILQKLPQSAQPRLDTEVRGINTPFHVPGEARNFALPGLVAHPAAKLVMALLVGVVVVGFWPESRKSVSVSSVPADASASTEAAGKAQEQQPLFPPKLEPEASASAPVSADAMKPATAGTTSVTAPVAVPVVAPVAAPLSNAAVAASAPVPVAAMTTPSVAIVAAASVAASESKAAAQVRSMASSPAMASEVPVVAFRVKSGSWVEVTDAKGAVQLRKTIFPGEVVTSSGALPLTVVVGKADVTTVEVRGKPFPMDAFVKENVARFEVK